VTENGTSALKRNQAKRYAVPKDKKKKKADEAGGRKSGKKRTTMLTTPVHDDDRVVLVASYGGDDRHPAWFLNVRDNPEVELEMKGKKRTMRAHVASTDEKAALWPDVVESHKGYAEYQTKTERDIPLVILEPA